MEKEDNKNVNLKITDSSETFKSWINKKYISAETKNKLGKADILIVPNEGFGKLDFPIFPVKTEELFYFIKKSLPKENKIDICIEDDDYKELALHADLIVLGVFIVTNVVLPTLVNILSEYLKKKIIGNDTEQKVKVSLTAIDSVGTSKKLTYEGPPEKLGLIIEQLKDIKKIK